MAFAEDSGRHVGSVKQLPLPSQKCSPSCGCCFLIPRAKQICQYLGIKPTWPLNNALSCLMRAPQTEGHLQRAREGLECIRTGNDHQGLYPTLAGITGKVPPAAGMGLKRLQSTESVTTKGERTWQTQDEAHPPHQVTQLWHSVWHRCHAQLSKPNPHTSTQTTHV